MIRRLREAFRGLEPYLRGNRKLVVAIAVTSTLLGFAEAALLYLIVQGATALTTDADVVTLSIGPISVEDLSLTSLFLVAGALLVFLAAIAVANSAAVAAMASRSLRTVRARTFSAFISASWEAQSAEAEGRLQEALTTHVQRVANGALQVSMAIGAAASFAAYLISAIAVDPVAASAVLVGVVLVGLALVPLMRINRRLARRHLRSNNEYSQKVAQAFRLAREIHVFDASDAVVADVERTSGTAEAAQYKSRFVMRLTPSIYQYLALALVIVGLAMLSATSSDNVSELGAVVLLLVRALSYGQQLSNNAQQLADSSAYVASLRDLQQRYERTAVERDGKELTAITSLVFRGASYGYDGTSLVLRDVDLALQQGDALGIVGPSGAGKSTLVQLLLRLRKPSSGVYVVNGALASSYSIESWTNEVAFVPQDNHLLTATVAENIRFYRDHVTRADVEAGAKAAHVYDEIVALPDGFDTMIGPGARDLSGGQRQRLGIARALAGSPSLLILDEPTSSLDARSEELIRETLHELKGRVILVVVAHRPTTLSMCDRVVRVHDGQVLDTTDAVRRPGARASRSAIG